MSEIGHELYWRLKESKLGRVIESFNPAAKIAREAFLKASIASGEELKPIRTIRSGEFNFGKYKAGSVFRIRLENGKNKTDFQWYAVGKSGSNPEVYCVDNPVRNNGQHVNANLSHLELDPDFYLVRLQAPKQTCFKFENAAQALSSPEEPTARIIELQKQNPKIIFEVVSIDLMQGGIESKAEEKRPASIMTPKLNPIPA